MHANHHHHPQPHISAAVKHLRGWITILAILAAVCCTGQMLIYGFVRFTDVRYTEVNRPAPTGDKARQVVVPKEAEAPTDSPTADPTATAITAVGGVRARAIEHGREIGPVRVLSNGDSVMSRLSLFCTSAGTLVCIMLAALTLLGTVIAGGANIPGVERTVTASTWALLLGLVCLPWGSMFPDLRIPGVFASYASLCAVADGAFGAASTTAALAQWILMPIACLIVSMVVLGMFRAGVERGVIATTPSHFDDAIQREMSDIARRGVTVAARTVGTMNRAVGMAAIPAPVAAPLQIIPPISKPSTTPRSWPLHSPATPPGPPRRWPVANPSGASKDAGEIAAAHP